MWRWLCALSLACGLAPSPFLPPSPSLRTLRGLGEVADQYRVFVLDQWGVLHDGRLAYPGALRCLEQLKGAGKVVVLLSNSSKRVAASYKGLLKVGIGAHLLDHIVTSGELAWNAIRNREFPYMAGRGDEALRVCVFGSSDEDEEYLWSCGCELSDPGDADFVLARGSFCFLTRSSQRRFDRAEDLLSASEAFLAACAEARLPMLVSNPDTHRPGSNAPMPGQLGAAYAATHGMLVDYVGKPHAGVYAECARFVRGQGGDVGGKFCMVGDSLEHDVAGARANGLDSVWISNGVHSAALMRAEGSAEAADESSLRRLIDEHGAEPTYVLPSFTW